MGVRLVLGLFSVFGLLLSCSPSPLRVGSPMLPVNFGALIPNAPFDAYAYLDQAQPFVFQSSEIEKMGASVPGLPLTLLVDSVALWGDVSRDKPVVAVRVDMTDLRMASVLVQKIETEAQAREKEVWTLQRGDVLNVVVGGGTSAAAYRQVMASGDYVRLDGAHRDVWNSVLALPETPSEPPIGAGFVNMSDRLVDYLASNSGLTGAEAATLERLKPLFKQAGILHAVFAAYGPSLPTFQPEMDLKPLWSEPFSGLLLFDSQLPAPVLDFLFQTALSGGDLKREMVNGLPTYDLLSRKGSLLVQNAGRTIVLAGGTDRRAAEGLLAAVNAAPG